MIVMARSHIDPITRAHLRAWLLYFRDQLGLSQKDLAAKLGITPSHLSQCLSGKKEVGLETFTRMRQFYFNANHLLDKNPQEALGADPPADPTRALLTAGARGRRKSSGGAN